MRPNKLSSLKQRLHRGTDAFEFQALINGVSTLEEEAAETGVESREAQVASEDEGRPTTDAGGLDKPTTEDTEKHEEGSGVRSQGAGRSAEPHLSILTPQPSETHASPREERLRAAMETLGCRLGQEVGRMRAAMHSDDVAEAGFYLAHVNQVLELLRSIDPAGDLARQMKIPGAPPEGRSWPPTAWSVVEFAESPLSGLLPAGAGESFVRRLLYAAWGIAFEAADA